MTLKTCTKCKKTKSLSKFHKLSRNKSTGRCPVCAECACVYSEKLRRNSRSTHVGFLKALSISSLAGAKTRELAYDLDFYYLWDLYDKQNGLCAITKIPMTTKLSAYKKGNKQSLKIPTNISLDRIDNTKGYLKDNVHLVCHTVNIMKQTLTIDELKYWCKAICGLL